MKRRIVRVLAVVLAAGMLWLLGSVICCAMFIRTAQYTIALPGMAMPVRAVVLSDLHGRTFGRNNARLLEKVRQQEADAVFLVGDMLSSDPDSEDVQRLLSLISALADIAPVYFAPGNHEIDYMVSDSTLLDQAAEAGAVVVNDSYVDVTIAGQPLRIGGTMGHGFYFGRSQEEFEASPEYQFLQDFQQTDTPKLCLAHMPDTFIFNGAYTLWDVDLVFSGHTHGGLIRLPLVGGLYAPMQGWFPEYDRGQFTLGEKMQLLITSGLAGYEWLPRVNNLPEIAVVELVPQNDS